MIKKTNKQTKANKKTEGIQVIAWLSNNSPKKKISIPHPRHGRVWRLALQSLGRILSYLTCMLPYHIVRKHIFNQINPHGKNSGDDGGQI